MTSTITDFDAKSEQILAAAAEIFAERGLAGTDVQDIADRVGVGKGSIYRRFETKERLFLAAAERGQKQLKAVIDQVAEKSDDPLEMIRATILAFLSFFDEHPAFVELVIQERAHFKDRATQTFFDFEKKPDDPWPGRIEGLVRDGVIRDLPVQQVMEVIAQLIYGVVFVNFFGGRKQSLAEQCDQLIDVIFHGILAPHAGAKHA